MARRVLKASVDSIAGLEIQEEAVSLNGSNENFFYADNSGCYINGMMSIRTNPENIRIATGYNFQPAYKCQIPSTTSTPQPMLVANPPIEGFSAFASEVADLLAELL